MGRGKQSADELEAELLRLRRRVAELERETRAEGIRRYRELFISSRDAVFITDGQGVVQEVNPAGLAMLGCTAADLAGRNFGDLYQDPGDAGRFVKAMLAGGGVQDFPVRLKGAGGAVLHTLITASAHLDEDGNPAGYQGIVRDVTQMVRDRQELVDNEVRYRTLFEAAGEPIFVMHGGRFRECNSRTLEVFGCTRQDILNQPPDKFSPPLQADGRPSAEAAHQYMTDSMAGKPQRFEWIHQRMDGTPFYCDITLNAFENQGKKSLLAVVRDITPRKEALRALEESEQLFRSLSEHAPDIIYTLDYDGTFAYVNPAWERILGHKPQEVEGRFFVDFVAPVDAARYVRLFKQIRDQRRTLNDVDGELVAKDGSLRSFSLGGAPHLDAHGRVLGMVGIFKDITPRKKAEEALRDSEERHRTLLEAAPDPVMVYDNKGRVTYLNPAFGRLFGWSLGELNQGEEGFVPNEQRQATAVLLSQVRSGSTVSGMESVRVSRDGRRVDVSISGAAFHDAEGRARGAVLTLQDVSLRKQAEEQLRYVAYHDTLTGLPNRKSFYEQVERTVISSCRLAGGSRRRPQPGTWALLFMDLDRFKTINDSLGHEAGDELLAEAARRIKLAIRKSDHLFRLGGDEFTVILNELKRDIDAARVAEKILVQLDEPFVVKGHELKITASMGISVFPNDGGEVEEIVRNADMAMYAAKEESGCYRFYTEEMNTKAQARLHLERDLRMALERGEFLLYYQPLVDQKHRILGCEALLRWVHPEVGLVPPSQFIGVAEETGAILPIGQWVLEEACRQVRAWHQKGHGHLFMAVNLSPRQFKQPDLVDKVLGVLEQTDLDPSALKLEVTETSVMTDPDDAAKKMLLLHQAGIRFAIDDFGTGYSSLSHLKRFPVDTLKIDRSFVAEATENQDDREIIRTILAMASNLSMQTVAEGVETRAQRDFLCGEGCGAMQGFFFGPPVPREEFEAMLLRRVLGE